MADFTARNAARLRIRRIPPIIVPQNRAVQFQHAQHFRRQPLFQRRIQNRSEHGKLHDKLKGMRRERQLRSVAADEGQNWKRRASARDAFRQQINPAQIFFGDAIAPFGEFMSAAAAEIENARVGRKELGQFGEQLANGGIAVLFDKSVRRVRTRIPFAIARVFSAARIFRAQPILVFHDGLTIAARVRTRKFQ